VKGFKAECLRFNVSTKTVGKFKKTIAGRKKYLLIILNWNAGTGKELPGLAVPHFLPCSAKPIIHKLRS
jgi:hypothetical protein